MLEVLALSPEDGWAFVRDGARTVLVRPPYTAESSVEVDGGAVGPAVSAYGFEADDKRVEGWPHLLAYLEERAAEIEPDGIEDSDDDLRKQFIAHASEQDLGEAINYVEEELLPSAEGDAALRLLDEVIDAADANGYSTVASRGRRVFADARRHLLEGREFRRSLSARQGPGGLSAYPLVTSRLEENKARAYDTEYGKWGGLIRGRKAA